MYLLSFHYEYRRFLDSKYAAENEAHKVLHARGGDSNIQADKRTYTIAGDSMKKNEVGQGVERYSWLIGCVAFQRDLYEMIYTSNIFDEIVLRI